MLAFFNTIKIMACVLTSGRTEPCKDSQGGISKAYFLDYLADAFTIAGGQATAINIGVTQVFSYELRADNNVFTEKLVTDKNAGTTVNTQTAEMRLKKQTYQSAAEIKLLAHARPIIVLVRNDGSYQAMGVTDGCDLTDSNIQSGGTKKDFNGYELTFTAEEVELAPYLDAATITAIDALVSATNVTP